MITPQHRKKKLTNNGTFSKEFNGGAVSGFTTGCDVCIMGEAMGCPYFGKEQKPPDNCPLNY